jgi:glutathione synthase/RimK-type ligase-like ATP-grasp enzyme
MKKIGVLHGRENSFPPAVIEKINSMNVPGIVAEPVLIDKVVQAADCGYAVILDRISQDVPFYRGFLKNAALAGTAVLNNPFWWSADEKFFNNALAESIGISVPKTVLLPSHHRPDDTDERSFRNMAFPLDWSAIFEYVGFPAFFKPFAGGGWKNVYKVHNANEFFKAYADTGQLVMMLQESIDFEAYYRCYYVGGNIKVMPYEPRNPFHERYLKNASIPAPILKRLEEVVRKLNEYLGYDFNTVEIAIRNDVLYPIDFCNPAPDADLFSVGQENFDWVVENAAKMMVDRAQKQVPGKNNLTWGKFVTDATQQFLAGTTAKPAAAKKAEAAPAKPEAPKKPALKKVAAAKEEAAPAAKVTKTKKS